MKEVELPEVGEVVICKVVRVLGYGVFVELPEYDNIKGFIHISQVASRWIKNIRNFVKEGQTRAAKVLSINTKKGQIDLSLTKVSEQLQREKIEQWKQLKRNKKLLELLAKKNKKSFDEVWGKVAEPLIEEYGSLSDAFQKIASDGEKAAKNVDKKFLDELVELVQKNVTVPKKTVKGIIMLSSFEPNGVELIKEALQRGISSTKDAEVEVYYSGGGKYVLKVTSLDYKVAERVIKFVSNTIIESIKATHGTGEFKRIN